MSHHTRTVLIPDEGVIRRPETKSFVLTSEFWVAAGAAAAVLLAGYAFDDIAESTAWRFFAWIAIAYIVSRGIAKAGSQRDYRPDPVRMPNGYGDENRAQGGNEYRAEVTVTPTPAGEAERAPAGEHPNEPRPMPREYHPADS